MDEDAALRKKNTQNATQVYVWAQKLRLLRNNVDFVTLQRENKVLTAQINVICSFSVI